MYTNLGGGSRDREMEGFLTSGDSGCVRRVNRLRRHVVSVGPTVSKMKIGIDFNAGLNRCTEFTIGYE